MTKLKNFWVVPRLAVIDSQFLIDVQDGDKVAEEVLFTIRFKGYLPAITATGAQELMDMALEDKSVEAMTILSTIKPKPDHSEIKYCCLDGIRNGHALFAAEELVEKGIIPEQDKNLALILAEAACLEAKIVILDEDELKALKTKEINKVLSGRDLPTIIIQDRMKFLEG